MTEDIIKRMTDLIPNPQQPHIATVILADTSGSMAMTTPGGRRKIDELNEGLKKFRNDAFNNDELARKRAEIALVRFDDTVEIVQDFATIDRFDPHELTTAGSTHMGEGILKAIEMIESRKNEYKNQGIDYFRPWIFLITDGEATDMEEGDALWQNVVHKVHDGERHGKFLFFAVGVEPMNMQVLGRIAAPTRPPVRLAEGRFSDMFLWLSKSQQKVSESRVGQQAQLPPVNWGTVQV